MDPTTTETPAPAQNKPPSGTFPFITRGKAGDRASKSLEEHYARHHVSPTGQVGVHQPDGRVKMYAVPLPPGMAAPAGPTNTVLPALPPPTGAQAAPDDPTAPADPAPLTASLQRQLPTGASDEATSDTDPFQAAAAEFPEVGRAGSPARNRFARAYRRAGSDPTKALHIARAVLGKKPRRSRR